VKLVDALKFSQERRASLLVDEGWTIFADDAGISGSKPTEPGSCIHEDIVESWTNMMPDVRKAFLSSEAWKPVNPKSPLVILAEAVDDWRED
jgi:hypothetical protein